MTTKDKQPCIFITGPESSGSTLIARIINDATRTTKWNGRGFNCCDDGQCDSSNGYMSPCKPTTPLICHRSLPFIQNWPPIDQWKNVYDGKFIICTRDKTICRHSQLSRFKWKDIDILNKEESKAISIIVNKLIKDPSATTFIWSYETYVLLGRTYLELLADFLNIPHENLSNIDHPRNENKKYIAPLKSKSLLSHFLSK